MSIVIVPHVAFMSDVLNFTITAQAKEYQVRNRRDLLGILEVVSTGGVALYYADPRQERFYLKSVSARGHRPDFAGRKSGSSCFVLHYSHYILLRPLLLSPTGSSLVLRTPRSHRQCDSRRLLHPKGVDTLDIRFRFGPKTSRERSSQAVLVDRY